MQWFRVRSSPVCVRLAADDGRERCEAIAMDLRSAGECCILIPEYWISALRLRRRGSREALSSRASAISSEERSILIGQHPRRSHVTWATPLVRALLSVCLMLAALVPYATGFLVPIAAAQDNCAMECCRRAKNCCCRQKSKGAQRGKHFTTAPECPPGCKQSAAVSGAVALAVPPQSARGESLAPERHSLDFGLPSSQSPQTAFALFGRPPPFSLRLIINLLA